jgi:hypothetical protein
LEGWPFNVVVLQALCESVRNGPIADENPLTGGLILAGKWFPDSQLMSYTTDSARMPSP